MPAVQYPFIDMAVHERVKDHFARGEAIVLFSLDMADVLWANGAGAGLFGKPLIYDLIDDGPNQNDVTFRQVEATARQLSASGEVRRFLIRIPSGFQRVPVEAVVERIHLTRDVDALLFAAPVSKTPLKPEVIAASMLEGFDDPDTHMAVLGRDGVVLQASPGFLKLGLTPATARTLVTMAASHPDRLVKRPVPTGKGYLPAAIGRVSEDPPMHLLFAVETILGTMGADASFPVADERPEVAELPVSVAESVPPELPTEVPAEVKAPATEAAASADTPQAHLAADVEAREQWAMPDATIPDPDLAPAADLAAPAPEVPEADTGDTMDPTDVEPVEDGIARADDAGAVKTNAPDLAPESETAAPSKDAAPVVENIMAAAPDLADTANADQTEQDGFSFNRSARPTRFVWKIDADGNFSEVSPELAATVGPHAASLPGAAFSDIAGLLGLDPDGKILELLGRRDTWSGKTIYWPVEGTTLKAPVDLAALPTYKRNREFDGFRGFGIVRLSDAVDDPDSIGLTLSGEAGRTSPQIDHDVPDAETIPPEEPFAFGFVDEDARPAAATDDAIRDSETGTAVDVLHPAETNDTAPTADDGGLPVGEPPLPEPALPEPDLPEPNEPQPVAPEPDLPEPEINEPVPPAPPRTEPPVLKIVEPPAPRETEKVIRLEERRQRGRDGLTPGEQEAFREIARQLEPFRRDGTEDTAGLPIENDGIASEPVPLDLSTPVTGEDIDPRQPEPTDSGDQTGDRPAAETNGTETHVDNGGAEEAPVQTEPTETDQSEPSQGALPKPETVRAMDPPSRVSESEQLEILAAAIPARTAQTGALTGDAIDEIPVALLIHAGDRLIHANPEFLRLSGYDALGELADVGGLDSLLHHKDLADMPEQSGGLSLVRADDTLIPVTARLQSVRWGDSNALLLALIPSGQRHDLVTTPPEVLGDEKEERLNAEVSELRVEVEELRSILETATDGVVIIGPEGDIRSMNRSASALFDYDDAETKGKPFVMLFAHESHRAVADYLAGMTGHGVASVLNDGREVIGREAAGGFIPLFMTIGKLSASSGFCAVIRDITQWKRSEEDLKSAKRAAETANAHKSDFLARVSHEIRTPLNAIIGFSDMMAIEHFGPIGHPRYVEYANDIARSGRLVLDIVNDLLDISKIEAGEMDLEFTAVGLNDAVSEAVSLVQPQAHTQRVIIRTAFSDAVPDVVADLRSVKQIVLNILANAIRFTQAGGQIVVSTSYETNGSVVLRIRDTGVGMTRAELEQAMKPFRQVTAGTRKRGDGTGLGLPLTKAMVDANRAGFTIQSAPNEGTLVEITFPSPRVLAN